MELDDFGGAVGGAIGGAVKWYQDPTRPLKVSAYLVSLTTSIVGGSICGYSVKAVVQWLYPAVPHDVTFAIAMGIGLGSGPILQSAVGLSSVLVNRVRGWIDYKFPSAPGSNGTTTAPGPDKPKG